MPEPLIDRRKAQLYAKGVVQRARGVKVPRRSFPYAPPPVPASVEPLPTESNLGADYDAEWARGPGARAVRSLIVDGVLRPSVAVVAKPERQGHDRLLSLDEKQNCLFVANHHSHLDTSLLLTSIPYAWRRKLVVGAAADYFFDTRVKAAITALALGAYPFDRTSTGRAAADMAADILDKGNSLLLFPEGGRSPDGWGRPFKGGAAYLAIRCDVPVVPIYLHGTGQVWRKGQRLPKPARTGVIFGDPIWPTEDDSTRRLNARIEAAVSSLGDELATDWWQARQRFHQQGPPSLEGPEGASWRRAWALGDRSRKRDRRKPVWPT